MSGQKIVGCCVHVATVIFYLAYARPSNNLSIPGEYLNNIFVKMEEFEPSNQPRYAINSRNRRIGNKSKENDSQISENETNSSTTSENETNSDETGSNHSNNNESCARDFSNGKSNFIKAKTVNNIKKKKKKFIETNKLTNKAGEIEHEKIFGQENFLNYLFLSNKRNSILNGKNQNFPKWGAVINFNDQKNIFVSDTCTIDNFLYAFWILSHIVPNFLIKIPSFPQTNILKEIIIEIDKNDWNKVRELWITKMMQSSVKVVRQRISLFGTESEFFLKYFEDYQKHSLYQRCKNDCSQNGKNLSSDSDKIYFKKFNNIVQLYSGYFRKCTSCKMNIESEIKFHNESNFLFIECCFNKITFDELPKKVEIHEKTFSLLCATLYITGHFFSIFELNGKRFLLDDLKDSLLYLEETILNDYYKIGTTTCLYYI